MSKLIKSNPISLAKSIISAHKRWALIPEGESVDAIVSTLARCGRRDVAEALSVLKSAKGRMLATNDGQLIKSASFKVDCQTAVEIENLKVVSQAIAILQEG